HALTESILAGADSLASLLTFASSSEPLFRPRETLKPHRRPRRALYPALSSRTGLPLPYAAALLLSFVEAVGAEQATRQDGESAEDQEFRAEAPDRPSDMPLAQLPEAPSIRLGAPRPEALEAIDLLLDRLVSPEAVIRERASRSLL